MRIAFCFIIALVIFQLQGQSKIQWSGQISAWGNATDAHQLPVWLGGRFMPQLNVIPNPDNKRKIDFEASANINGLHGFRPFDISSHDGTMKPYRLWLRYSANQFELRAGLQKINFGSASMIRPLMWFDKVDPRDPLQLTDGVWGLLGRYYFINNANIWIWVLYGNKDPKTWEYGYTSNDEPEWGARVQHPVSMGEIALTFHHRLSDAKPLGNASIIHQTIHENRLGIDGKWDVGPGVWFEGVWIHKNVNIGDFTNQQMVTLGADYTFGLGNGLNAIIEHLVFSWNKNAFDFDNTVSFSTLSGNYPFGLNSQVSAVFYYDWNNNDLYNMLTLTQQYNHFSLHCMVFCNPENYRLPISTGKVNLFAGNGIQIMGVWHF